MATAREILADILSRVSGSGRSGRHPNQYMARCPAHDDSDQSLAISISDDESKVLLHCFCGCSKNDIVLALGMDPSQVNPEKPSGAPDRSPAFNSEERYTPPEEWERKVAFWVTSFGAAARKRFSEVLDLPEEAFSLFPQLGAHNDHPRGPCWTHPETDPDGRITGVSQRIDINEKDNKPCAIGSKRGLTIPNGWAEHEGPLFIVEGLSDTIAMTYAGLAVIGRPGVAAGLRLCADFIEKHVPKDREVIVVGENDGGPSKKNPGKWEWPGLDAARAFTAKLSNELKRDIKMCFPPNSEDKDARKWLTRLVADGANWGSIRKNWLNQIKPTKLTRFDEVKPSSPNGPGSTDPAAVVPAPDAPKPRKPVCLDGTDIMATNDEIIDGLKADENLYASGNRLVWTKHRKAKVVIRWDEKQQKDIAVVTVPAHLWISAVDISTLREKISRVCDTFRTHPQRGAFSVLVPDPYTNAISNREDWPALKNLVALTDYPVLRPDGTMVTTAGHDEQTGVYYNPTCDVVIPENPTREHAIAAWKELQEVICNFPFEHPEIHKAVWLAALLTPMTRFAYQGCVPVFMADANMAGSGKGLVIDMVSMILTGRPFATMGYTDDDTEMSKRITTMVAEGQQLVMLDNITGGFGGPVIDRAVTSLEWCERMLGSSKSIRATMKMGIYGTGNNIEYIGDMGRRLCGMRLESKTEKPEERQDFIHKDLRAWVMMNRPRLLSAAATILAAYYNAGAPRAEIRSWGSFEAWSDCVRQCVVWIGCADPYHTRERAFNEADVYRSAVRAVIANWKRISLDDNPMTANQIVSRVCPLDSNGRYDTPPNGLGEVAEAFKAVYAKPTGKHIGNCFRRHRETRFSEGYITSIGEDRNGVMRWIVHCDERVLVKFDHTQMYLSAAGGAGGAGDSGTSQSIPKSDEESSKSEKTLPTCSGEIPRKPRNLDSSKSVESNNDENGDFSKFDT
jgi:hypothetical protein